LLVFFVFLHYWFVDMAIVASMAFWRIWQRRRRADVEIRAVVQRIENKNLSGFLQVRKEEVSPQAFDLMAYTVGKANRNIEIIGSARLGKTSLGEYFCTHLPEKKTIISFKHFVPDKRDFNIGYSWVDVRKFLPNLFSDPSSFVSAFRTAFFADLSSKGLMIDTIISKVNKIMARTPKDFEEFYRILEDEQKHGNFEESVANIVKDKVQLLERATEGAKHGKVDFSKGNIVLDLGNLPEDEIKSFVAEYYLRQIYRIEETKHSAEKIYVVIDEAWHLLKFAGQKSIIGTMLLQGAYVINLMIITQNFCHLDKDYRGHFGCIYCFHNSNDEDMRAIEGAHGAYMRDAVRLLSAYQFLDLKYEHGEEIIPTWQLRYENLELTKAEARFCSEPDEGFVEDEPKPIEVEKKEEPKLGEKILNVLKENNLALYGYEIGKAIELSPKEAGLKVKQPLRILVKEGKVKEWKCQIRNKEVSYYYLANDSREVCHNLMMQETKKKLGDWSIVFEATHGIQGADFVIEKDGRKLSIECETLLKKDISDLQSREAKTETIIVVPTNSAKESYQQLFECKVVLIPELEDVLKN